MFALDRADANADDLMLAEIVARLVSGGLDQVNLAAAMRENAAAAERIRLSRDLHDGLLQSLSGLALHVQSARRSIESDPQAAQQRLEIVVEQLAEGQRVLRDFVDELRPESIARNVATEWSVDVELHAGDGIDAGDGALAGHLASIIAETLSNAAKHAGATRIRAAVDVEDDGSGFPFQGRSHRPRRSRSAPL